MIEARLFAYQLLEELRRDIPLLDYSALALPKVEVEACVVFKQDGIAAGVEEAAEFLKLLGFSISFQAADGTYVQKGGEALCFVGPAREVVKVERTVLNVIIHASGIATYVRRLVERVKAVNPKCRVAATRKTLPFLRYLEKKAVLLGGGDPHRGSLSDAVMYKDSHLAVASIEGLSQAPTPFVLRREVEVSTAEGALKAAELGFEVIMLDNAPPEEVAKAHKLLAERGLRVILEASGGITEENIHLYAPYVDVISIGKITHSAPALDASMEVREVKARVGVLGYGALGSLVAELIARDNEMRLVAVYDIDREKCKKAEALGAKCVKDVEELISHSQFVVETAGAEAVLQHGCKILEAGRHLIAATVGAAATLNCKGDGMLFLPSGAVGGLDLLAASGGRVIHKVVKAGDFKEGGPASVLYWRHPRNLNSSVALQMASGSEVHVVFQGGGKPGVNIHEIEVEHPWGRAFIKLENYASGHSSLLAARSIYTLLKSAVLLLNRRARVVVGTFKAL
ncbi:MAG: carboxylating nicotinate-nucleotide diphosphorylase [Pyrobaculum sp.]